MSSWNVSEYRADAGHPSDEGLRKYVTRLDMHVSIACTSSTVAGRMRGASILSFVCRSGSDPQSRSRYRASVSIDDRVRSFRQLHESGCFVIPNPWDVGSARLLAQLGFPAVATTSAGLAWSLGHPDNRVTLEAVLAHLRSMAEAISIPINADFEGGF